MVESRESRVESQNRRRQAEGGGRKVTNPPFHTPHSALRTGITLTEVLISMGILTVGLLGVASVFPVGAFYTQKATIADNGSAIAQSVMNDLVAKGMLDPRQWWVLVPPQIGPAGPGTLTFASDVPYVPTKPTNPIRGTYTRPFAYALSEALTYPAVATDGTIIGKQFGSAFVIDPLGVAAMASPNNNFSQRNWNAVSSTCPSSAYQYAASFYGYSSWQPWGSIWPIRRVTFRQPIYNAANDSWQMDSVTAGHYFRATDDLTSQFPPRTDRPASQDWDTSASQPLARQFTGNYSWLATVTPPTNAARDGMAKNPSGHEYMVSVVVFYKRVLPAGALAVFDATQSQPGAHDQNFNRAMGAGERTVGASVVSTGLNGGELLLTDLDRMPPTSNPNPISPFDTLKVGEWVMLCGPHPNSIPSEPRFSVNWYQVLAVDKEGNEIQNPDAQRIVSLRGPQWPWQRATTLTNYSELSNNLCVGIFRGAVAVHTRKLHLESPRGISSASFGNGNGNGTYDPPPAVTF